MYRAHCAVIFAIAQLSCTSLFRQVAAQVNNRKKEKQKKRKN